MSIRQNCDDAITINIIQNALKTYLIYPKITHMHTAHTKCMWKTFLVGLETHKHIEMSANVADHE